MFQEKVAAFQENRAKFGPLPTGIAPYTSSKLFQTQRNGLQPTMKQWEHQLSSESQGRTESTLKANSNISPNMISLGTGRPAPGYFPWDSMTVRGVSTSQSNATSDGNELTSMCCKREDKAFDFGVAMSYGYAAGSPQVLRFITEHVELIHNPLYNNWESCLTCGTTSAIDILFRMFCERGEWIISEAHSYPGTIEGAKALGLNLLGVDMDEDGLMPEDLDFKLRNWDLTKGKKPFILYIIPCGQNPTGCTQPAHRRYAIYQVAEKHDLIIIEDDPYYFLHLGEGESEILLNGTSRSAVQYYRNLPASYLSLDSSGRVIRLDSTSKILAPGLRCGWLTACSQVVEKFLSHTEMSTVSPSGPSQVMLYKLLDETWGHEGFLSWLNNLSLQYCRSRNVLVESCKVYLPSHVCQWTVPTSGMFLWIQIDWSKHPSVKIDTNSEDVEASRLGIEDRIYARAKQNGVVVSKGSWFEVDRKIPSSINFRMTFAAASEDALVQGVQRFGNAVIIEFSLD